MAEIILQQSIAGLLDQWMEAEKNGAEFPVPFDMAWPMAGYGRKSTAKRDGLRGLKEGKHFCTEKCKNALAGRPVDLISLSLDGFKHLCLMADTPEGEAIRDYYIEQEKKWKIVEAVAPKLAEEIEIIRAQQELEKLRQATHGSELALLQYRNWITQLPEPVQQKILGYTEVKTIEYRDRVLDGDQLVRDGSTINKTALCHRYGLLSKTGSPNYKQLKAVLDQMPSEAFKLTAIVRESEELNIEYLPELDKLFLGSARQLGIGE